MREYIQGTEKLRAKLKTLKDKTVKAAIRKGTRAGSKIIAAGAKQLAPRRTGALAAAIKVRALPRSRRYVGTTVKLTVPYGAAVEYGTRLQRGQHFLERAVEATKRQAIDTTLEIVAREVVA